MPGLGREVPLNSQDSPRFIANPGGASYTPQPLTEESGAMTFKGRWSAAIGAGVCALLVVLWSSAVGLKDAGTDVTAATAAPEVLYAPEDKPADRLVALYQGAQHTIYLATYGLTYPPVVKALIAAKKRGVEVRVITDRGKLDDRNQRAALETLRLAGVPIKVNRHHGLMRVKQVVVA